MSTVYKHSIDGDEGEEGDKQGCCIGIRETMGEDRMDPTRPHGRSWLTRKLMVSVTVALIIYAAYVYLARFTVKLVQRRSSRPKGIALLIVFSILFLWTMWAYIKVVLTSPGYARDHIPKSPRPLFPDVPRESHHTDQHEPTLIVHSSPQSRLSTDSYNPQAIGGPAYVQATPQSKHPNETDTAEGDLTLKVPIQPPSPSRWWPFKPSTRPAVYVARRPSRTPVLHPAHRYCSYDEIVKPYRSHHCRTCGTCVLKYDHHCPWIGQCVGARNHKFFVNFLQACSVFTIYTFATLLPYTIEAAVSSVSDLFTSPPSPTGYLDVQLITIVALSGAFALFTISLGINHAQLICHSQTTVESLLAREQEEREAKALNSALGHCAFTEKRRTRKEWDREWGDIRSEGNLWWIGSGRKAWEDVMGSSVWEWFLPIGRGASDGLAYVPNPRFDPEGRWRRRGEWPVELRGSYTVNP